jgi:hypothetical protein
LTARKPISLIIAAASVAALCLAPAAASADTYTVTSFEDAGPGTLRQAVLDANAHPGHDKIDFAPDVDQAGTGSDPLEITSDLEIDGPGSDKLRVGFGRGFLVKGGGQATISGMTISHTSVHNGVGGAVRNQGTLTLDGVLMELNNAIADPGSQASGAAIANTGTLTLKNSTLTRNFATGNGGGSDVAGGAITNSGTMTLDHARLINNVAHAGDTTASGGIGAEAKGGGIFNTGDLTLVDSTLLQNQAIGGAARDEGGDGLGGAIYNSGSGALTVRGSTLNDNIAGGGGGSVAGLAIGGAIENFDPATFAVKNSTITGNAAIAGSGSHQDGQSIGGGIDNQSTFTHPSTVLSATISNNGAFRGSNIENSFSGLSLQNTIVANPRRPDGGAAQNCGHPSSFPSAIKSLGYNIDSGSSCELTKTGDRSDTDPQLKPLADNGGATETMAIPLSSPALDQGVSGGLTTDQRGQKRPVIVPGVPRPQGGDGSDIGAYEYQPGPAGHSRIIGSVSPDRTHVGERTCFRFKAKRQSDGPMANVQVKFAGKRARTDERGKATVCKAFHQSEVRHPRLRKRGHERARLRVAVR